MIDYETYARIKNYFENDGLKYSQIAECVKPGHPDCGQMGQRNTLQAQEINPP